MRKLSLVVLVVWCALPLTGGEWNAVGSERIIDESSLNFYELSGARLQFRPGAVGTIVARYPNDIINMNFQQYAYCLEATLTRATTASSPKLLMISLP
ncbi:MAG TPA: hypothetical protein VEO54_30405 [Thermoanaerobaculia bacterium]|nr:hypothetical protein [Thermoanaerobaculia bacterium]